MKNELTRASQILTPLEKDVQERFGVLPNFFRLTPENPEITENLWGFAKFAYLDNPLPSLFKERLFVYLSRFCDVRYCIARHAGFLNGLGRPSADKHSQIQSIDDIVRLINIPLPREKTLIDRISLLLDNEVELKNMPEADSETEYSIFACASHVFLQTTSAALCLDALQRVMGPSKMQYLSLFLSFVRMAHYWTKLHPELRFEDDINNLLKTHQQFAACILKDPEASSAQISERTLDELLLLRAQSEKYESLSNEHEELIKAYQISKQRTADQQKEIQTQVAGRYNAEQKFQYLSESGLINICFFTIDGKIHDANNSFLVMTGYSMEELNLADLSLESLVTTESKTQLKNSLQHLTELKILAPYPVDFINKHGQKVSGLFGAMKIEEDAPECVGFVVDISDLKKSQELLVNSLRKTEESEEYLRGAINLAELATWTIDVQNNRLHFSKALRNWIGASENDMDLDDLFPVIQADERERVRASILKAYTPESGGAFQEHYSIVNKVSGRKRILESIGKTIFNENGAASKMVGTARDITAQQNLQLELEQQISERTKDIERTNEKLRITIEELATSNSNLIRSNDELAQYAYVASHDLQEPLRKIRTFSDILTKRSDLIPNDKKYVDKISKSALRMSDLIKNLLEYSKILQSDLKNTQVDLSQVFENVMKDFELVIEEKQAVIETSNLPVIEGVEFQINQLFCNLISNALKFSQDGIAPRITIGSRPVANDELTKLFGKIPDVNFIDISFTDNGIGFERQYIKQIFEIFGRLHLREIYPGSGIGLALCKRIVSNHNGYIHVESEVGKGSTFHIILPVKSKIAPGHSEER